MLIGLHTIRYMGKYHTNIQVLWRMYSLGCVPGDVTLTNILGFPLIISNVDISIWIWGSIQLWENHSVVIGISLIFYIYFFTSYYDDEFVNLCFSCYWISVVRTTLRIYRDVLCTNHFGYELSEWLRWRLYGSSLSDDSYPSEFASGRFVYIPTGGGCCGWWVLWEVTLWGEVEPRHPPLPRPHRGTTQTTLYTPQCKTKLILKKHQN